MDARTRAIALATKGFMPENEGDALADWAIRAAQLVAEAPMLEVGSYCGRSTVWLGDAARSVNRVLFAVDHHRGSEENQAGWEWHDSEVVDVATGKMDTLPFFRRAIYDAGLEDHVIAVVGKSPNVARALNQHVTTTDCGLRMLPLTEFWRSMTCSLIQKMVGAHRMRRSTFQPSSQVCLQKLAWKARYDFFSAKADSVCSG